MLPAAHRETPKVTVRLQRAQCRKVTQTQKFVTFQTKHLPGFNVGTLHVILVPFLSRKLQATLFQMKLLPGFNVGTLHVILVPFLSRNLQETFFQMKHLPGFNVGTLHVILVPFLSRNLQETLFQMKHLPDFNVGTLHVYPSTILKPEPSGNPLPDETSPRF